MKTKLPENFVRVELSPLKKESDSIRINYWIYNGNISKEYSQASAEETITWAEKLYPRIKEDSEGLTKIAELLTAKATILDMSLIMAMFRHRNLFGGPEFWDKIEEWKRFKRMEEKGRKKND